MWEMYGMNVWTSGCTVLYACMIVLNVLYVYVVKWLYSTVLYACMNVLNVLYECVDKWLS